MHLRIKYFFFPPNTSIYYSSVVWVCYIPQCTLPTLNDMLSAVCVQMLIMVCAHMCRLFAGVSPPRGIVECVRRECEAGQCVLRTAAALSQQEYERAWLTQLAH